MMRLLKFLIFIFFLSYVNAQEREEIDIIKFEYFTPHISFSEVEIFIFNSSPNQNDFYDVNVKYYKFTTQTEKHLKIPTEEFNKIVNQFQKINSVEFMKSFETGLDGSNTSIEVGSLFNSVKYKVWGLTKGQTNVGHKELLLTAQMILKAADIKINELN